jgi:hypothetical protein
MFYPALIAIDTLFISKTYACDLNYATSKATPYTPTVDKERKNRVYSTRAPDDDIDAVQPQTIATTEP